MEQNITKMQKNFQDTLDGLEKKKIALQNDLASTSSAIDQYKGAVQALGLLQQDLAATAAAAAAAPQAPESTSAQPKLKVVPQPAGTTDGTSAPTADATATTDATATPATSGDTNA